MDLEYKNLTLNICYFSSSNKRDIKKWKIFDDEN